MVDPRELARLQDEMDRLKKKNTHLQEKVDQLTLENAELRSLNQRILNCSQDIENALDRVKAIQRAAEERECRLELVIEFHPDSKTAIMRYNDLEVNVETQCYWLLRHLVWLADSEFDARYGSLEIEKVFLNEYPVRKGADGRYRVFHQAWCHYIWEWFDKPNHNTWENRTKRFNSIASELNSRVQSLINKGNGIRLLTGEQGRSKRACFRVVLLGTWEKLPPYRVQFVPETNHGDVLLTEPGKNNNDGVLREESRCRQAMDAIQALNLKDTHANRVWNQLKALADLISLAPDEIKDKRLARGFGLIDRVLEDQSSSSNSVLDLLDFLRSLEHDHAPILGDIFNSLDRITRPKGNEYLREAAKLADKRKLRTTEDLLKYFQFITSVFMVRNGIQGPAYDAVGKLLGIDLRNLQRANDKAAQTDDFESSVFFWTEDVINGATEVVSLEELLKQAKEQLISRVKGTVNDEKRAMAQTADMENIAL